MDFAERLLTRTGERPGERYIEITPLTQDQHRPPWLAGIPRTSGQHPRVFSPYWICLGCTELVSSAGLVSIRCFLRRYLDPMLGFVTTPAFTKTCKSALAFAETGRQRSGLPAKAAHPVTCTRAGRQEA